MAYKIILNVYKIATVHLTSIHHPQIGGEFTATPGVLANIFMVARTILMCELVLAIIKYVLALLEVGPEFDYLSKFLSPKKQI